MDQILVEKIDRIEGNQPSTSTPSLSVDEREQREWRSKMYRAGIPQRYSRAHLQTNCQKYANWAGKQEALARAMEMAENGFIQSERGDLFAMLITGGFGSGKSWIGTGLFKHILYHREKGQWVKAYQFIRRVQEGYADDTAGEVLRSYQRAPVLMLDDLGDLDKSETDNRVQLVYELIDYRNDHLLPTIITTNLEPNELSERFGERTFQRVAEMSAIVRMGGENLRFVNILEEPAT